jgi:hypothetical protein
MSDALTEISHELSQLLTRLVLTADAEAVIEQTNDALRHARLQSAAPAPKRESWRPTLTPRPSRPAA